VTNLMNLWTLASSCGVSITEMGESSCRRARRWPKSFARKIERMHSNHQAAELSHPSCCFIDLINLYWFPAMTECRTPEVNSRKPIVGLWSANGHSRSRGRTRTADKRAKEANRETEREARGAAQGRRWRCYE
jgi:hypothetical protein